MKKLLFIETPTLKKGEKIVNLFLVSNNGNVMFTDWKATCNDKELIKRIKDLEKLDKKIDKKLGL